MKPVLGLFLSLSFVFIQTASAQSINQLSATSNFVCISGSPNLVGKFTKTGYRLVSSGAAKDAITEQKDKLQSQIDPLKNVQKEISKGKLPKKGETTTINTILKSIGNNRLKGDKDTKLAVLKQSIAIVKGLVALKKIELQALSDCTHNDHKAKVPPGSTVPRVVVVRNKLRDGLAVIAVVERDSRLYPPGAYCAMKNGDTAFEADLKTNPCPSGFSATLCEGILGANRVGFSLGYGANFGASSPGEAAIQALVGVTTTQVASEVYQIRKGEAGKTCGQVFGQ